jgi:hypothetical protein
MPEPCPRFERTTQTLQTEELGGDGTTRPSPAAGETVAAAPVAPFVV